MSKTIKVLLAIAAVLVILAALLGIGGWAVYKWVMSGAETSLEQGKTIRAEVESFSGTLPETDRAKFQACWQKLNGPEFSAKVQAVAQERLEKVCHVDDVESVQGAQELMRCATNLGVEITHELAREHFRDCKRQIGR
jgi:hypothetical protein